MISFLRWCFVAIPVLALLPRGSVSIEAQAVFASLCALLMMACIIFCERPAHTAGVMRNCAVLLVVLLSCVALQSVLPFAGPFSAEAWTVASEVTGEQRTVVSVAPADTLSSLLQISAPFLIFCVGLVIMRTDDQAIWAIATLARAGAVLAGLALFQYMAAPDTLLFWQKRFYLDSFTATFVNRNTAATFLGFVVLVLSGLLLDAVLRKRHRVATALIMGHRLAAVDRRKAWGLILDAVLLCISAVGLLLTVSRAGNVSVFLALILLLIIGVSGGQARSEERPLERRMILGSRSLRIGGAIFLVMATLVVFSGQVQLRADVGGLSDPRFCVYPSILDAIRQNWLAGTGFGTFLQTFAAFRPPECGLFGVWDRAHSFYLEGLLGLGLVFLPILGAGLFVLSNVLIEGIRNRRRLRIYPVIGISVLVLALLHSLLDFSLQLPALSLFLAALMAPVVSICLSRQFTHGTV